MASRAQLSTSLCRSSVKVPFRLEAMAGGWGWAWLFTAAPTVLVLLVPAHTDTAMSPGQSSKELLLAHHRQPLKRPCRLILSFNSRTHWGGNCKDSYRRFLRLWVFTLQQVLQVVSLRGEWQQPTGLCRRKKDIRFQLCVTGQARCSLILYLWISSHHFWHRSILPWRTMLDAE